MFNKDVTHSKMRRRIENPRILLLDCPLEYKKGESQANVEIQQEEVGLGLGSNGSCCLLLLLLVLLSTTRTATS